MSSHPVQLVQIERIEEHPNADRLSIAHFAGWQTVVPKGAYSVGQAVVYVPISSVLAIQLEEILFPPDSKIKLDKSRVKSIKIRGALSQGMVVDPRDQELQRAFPALTKAHLGDDVADLLGITKYEPPAPHYQQHGTPRKGSWKNHPDFAKYTDVENWKYYPELFKPEELISVTEKVHGTSARYGRYLRNPHSRLRLLHRFLEKVGLRSKTEFVYGSRNIQLQTGGPQYYRDDVYAQVGKALKLDQILSEGESIYGEIVGPGIQKGYTYGVEEGHEFYAYDVRTGNEYLSPPEFREWCLVRSIPMVPVIYEGPRDLADIDALAHGPSVVAPVAQPVREGIVVKPVEEGRAFIGRKVLKRISDDYLLKDQSESH